MALNAYWHENFQEWVAGQRVAVMQGTGWSTPVPGSEATVTVDADFPGGRCINYTNNVFPTIYSISQRVASALDVVQWMAKRVSDFNGGAGIIFGNSLGNFLLIVHNELSPERLDIYSQIGATRTLLASVNNISGGVVYNFALEINGTHQFYVQGGSGIQVVSFNPGLAGGPWETVRFGNFFGAATAGVERVSHLYGYSGQVWVGPAEIRSGFATADDVLQDWGFVGGASAWESINNPMANPATQYIESAVSGDISDFKNPIDDTNVFQVFSASLECYAERTDVTPVDMEQRLGQGVTFTAGATKNPPQNSLLRLRDFFDGTNPNTGLSWAPADLPTLLWGADRTS